MKNLTEKLADVFSEFFGIGLQLGIDESKLKEFEHNYQSAGRRFSEVISYWLRRNTDTPVTWESLITVLKSRSVNQKGLAQSLEEQYIVKSNPQIASTPTQKGTMNMHARFPIYYMHPLKTGCEVNLTCH